MQSAWILRSILLLCSATLGLIGLSGFKSGWCYAKREVSHSRWAPEISVELSIGWWNYTSHVELGFVPVDIRLQGKGGRVLGTVTAVCLAGASAACLLIVANTRASSPAADLSFPAILQLSPRQKHQTARLAAACVITLTLLLYGVLAAKVHDKLKKHAVAGQSLDVWPRPDWAFASALTGGLLLLLSTFHLKTEPVPSVLEGYLPL